MRRILISLTLTLSLLAFAQNAQASCTYHTYTVNGRIVSCSTCCYGNQCYTNCY
jgi:type IV secretory pathway TrbL component